MSTYVLIENFSDKIRVVNISKNLESLTRKMKSLAVEFIHDAIGKNNYVDTLAPEYANVQVSKCPLGYVLKFSDTQNVSPKLTVFLNEKLSGYVYDGRKTTVVGYYIIVPADETDGNVCRDVVKSGDSLVDTTIQHAWGKLGSDLAQRVKEKSEKKAAMSIKIINEDVNVEKPQQEKSQPEQPVEVKTQPVVDDLSAHIVDDHMKPIVAAADDSVNVFKKELVEKALEIRSRIGEDSK
jgi:hypothetical protein